jgi:hypothetical protein
MTMGMNAFMEERKRQGSLRIKIQQGPLGRNRREDEDESPGEESRSGRGPV